MQHDTSIILCFEFKNTFIMKDFICFTDIVIYKQFSCHEFIKNINFCNKYRKINNFELCLVRQLKLNATRHV
jgi:hypothetical protein